MEITLGQGNYIVAVSGGVDSVVLLHLLQTRPELKLTVAHFDHGIRPDSNADQLFVRSLAASYDVPYVFARGQLGPHASEAAARQARYDFLRSARLAASAKAVVTAHHQNDVLETAILNIVRGTSRRGLTSLRSTDFIKRPLLHMPKTDIISYARAYKLVWREDSTNASDDYKRNYVRHRILTKFSAVDRSQLYDVIVAARTINTEIDDLIDLLVAELTMDGELIRRQFFLLPHAVAREVMAAWLRKHGVANIDRKMLERLVHGSKLFAVGQQINISGKDFVIVKKDYLALKRAER